MKLMAFDDADMHSTYHVAGETDHVIPGFNQPKKEKYKSGPSKKMILSAIGVLALTVGVLAGVLLLQNSQDVRRQAATPAPTFPPKPTFLPTPSTTPRATPIDILEVYP